MESRGEGHETAYGRGARSPGEEHMGDPEERRSAPTDRESERDSYRAFRERAADALEEGKRRVAGGMESLGGRLEERGESLAEEGGVKRRLGRAMESAGDAMGSGGAYLRNRPVEAIGDDVVESIREHPLLSVGIALGAGFLFGRLLAGGGADGDWEDDEGLEDWDDEEDEEAELPRYRTGRRGRRRARSLGLGAGLRSELGRAVISSVAALAARQLRERIAGAEATDEELEDALDAEE